MLGKGKLGAALSFIVVMTFIGCVFFVEMPTTNAGVITTLGSAYLSQLK
jgi:hypothetical protein